MSEDRAVYGVRPLPCVRDEHGEIREQTVKQLFAKIDEELNELKQAVFIRRHFKRLCTDKLLIIRTVIQMKIPKVLKEKMHKLAKLSKEASELHNEISEWFCSKGFDEEALRCGNGESLDELIYGNDVTDEFCARIESGEFDDAVSPFHIHTEPFKNMEERIADEAADTITAITTMLEALDIDAEMRDEAQRRVNKRNRERGRL